MGQPMGPLQLADFIGLMCVAILNVMYDGFKIQNMPCPLLVNMVRAGKMGVKSVKVSMIILKVKKAEKISKQFI
jgi:3-hydroxybutyryl-CoA dehydrogenase